MNTPKGLNSMNMKKIAPLTLSVLLLGTVTVGAQQNQNNVTEDVKQPAAFIQTTGEISGIESSGDSKRYFNDSEENPFHFSITKSTLILDKKGNVVDLKQGDTVTLYILADQPMIMIYPPLYSPAVVIVGEESESNFVKVAQFDKNFVSEDKQLKLNISDDIVIVNEKGERTSKDEVIKQNTIVFYGSTTKSIPAQTTPYKLIVFPKTENPYVEENPETTETIDTTKLDAIFQLNPDIVIATAYNKEDLKKYKQLHCPVFFINSWQENSPLGRVEWIKFLGILIGKSHEADSIFDKIAHNYHTIKSLADSVTEKPLVLAGSATNEMWYLPGGKSYIATFIADAGGTNIRNDNQTGSEFITFENLILEAQNAKIWIGCDEKTYSELDAANKNYKLLNAYKNKQMYNRSSVR